MKSCKVLILLKNPQFTNSSSSVAFTSLSRSGGPWQLYGMAGVFSAAGGDDHLGTLADTGIGCLCNERSMARGSGAFSRIHTDTKKFLMESMTTGSF